MKGASLYKTRRYKYCAGPNPRRLAPDSEQTRLASSLHAAMDTVAAQPTAVLLGSCLALGSFAPRAAGTRAPRAESASLFGPLVGS